ncbi:hypothetical protein QYE76_070522 [Lolium multiflorum]|uniref:Uncharacterized protein n=1 Tax=Lolium multiflorum TaxID=4521 RepID=A0AAD8SIC2_LOLMU|nr:hypothetical protein QYE76_070522 [Lolium multiflorum]
MMRATEFQELVDAAITLEDDFKQLQEEKRKKAKYEPRRRFSKKVKQLRNKAIKYCKIQWKHHPRGKPPGKRKKT